MSPFHNDILISLCKLYKLPFISAGEGKLQGISNLYIEYTRNLACSWKSLSRDIWNGCPSENTQRRHISNFSGGFTVPFKWDKAKPRSDPMVRD